MLFAPHPYPPRLPFPCTAIWLPAASTCHSLAARAALSLLEVPPKNNPPPWLTRVGGWTPQLPYLSGELTLRCVFYGVSQGFPSEAAPQLPTVVTGLITHNLLAAFLSPSHFPVPYQCFLRLTPQWTICIECLSQGLLLEETHIKKATYLMNLEQ